MRVKLGAVTLAAGLLAACAARSDGPRQPILRELETEAVQATAPRAPLRIVFDWTAQEPDARFTGRGAARIQPPYHARLDLFGPRGEGYLSAAVVDGTLRLPSTVAPATVPPAPLLWSVLGVFRPPEDAILVGTTREGTTTRLEYDRSGERWTFVIAGDRLRSARWERPDGGRYTVELKGRRQYGLPEQATYRDWAAFTELTLKLDEVERVEPFPPEIWTPGGP